MSDLEPIRLLILDESQNRAEELIILLRNAGRATRAHKIESEDDLINRLKEQPWDLFLSRWEADGVSAEQAIQHIRNLERDIPVIMLADSRDPSLITEGLEQGAQDVALADDNDRLKLIIARELNNLQQRRSRRRAEAELRESDKRNQLLLESSSAAIAYVHEGMHIYANKAYGDLFGYDDPDDFAGIPIIDLIAPEDQGKFKALLKSYEEKGEETDEFTCVASDDSKILSSLHLSPATYDGEQCTQVIFKAMTSDSELEDRIREISSQDLLTGLFNRQFFVEQLDTAVDQVARGQQDQVMAYIGIDHFSQIRSEAGISNADLILGDLAALVKEIVGDDHLLSRFGDDVFAMLFRGNLEDATAMAEDIRARVEKHMSEISGKSYHLTVSIGVAQITESTTSGDEIIARSHRAQTKIEDGNGVQVYEPEAVKVGDGEKSLSVSDIAQLVKQALANNTLKLLFQPIISLHGDDDEQFEVLLRLPDDGGNELKPGQFLGAAEEANLLEKIDRWVILQSVKLLADHRAEGSQARLFINVTHKSVADDTFLPWVSVALKAARLPSDAVIFQVHENDATSYIKHAKKFTQGVSQLHCKSSINHFGCSLNPFALLKHLTPDYVKLDGSFANDLDSEEKQQELIEMVQSLQSKGVLTAISGVEDPSILPTLWQTGINFIQGNYISEPQPDLEYDFSAEAL